MIPRNEVAGIDLDDDLEAIISQLRTTPHTRLPVFRNDINQIEGIVHMRQIARLLSHDQLTKESLLAACTEPYFVPENTPLSTQLLNFQKQKRRIGIVVDEYGDVRGVVTLEDILEEIVGEFSNQDTLRSPRHPPAGRRHAGHRWRGLYPRGEPCAGLAPPLRRAQDAQRADHRGPGAYPR